MTTFVNWKASRVSGKIVKKETKHGGTILVPMAPAADPIDDAVNNVRFSIVCVSHEMPDRATCLIRTNQRFNFRVTKTGHLRANICAAPQGGTLFAASAWAFPNLRGIGEYWIEATMRVKVTDPLGNTLVDDTPNVEPLAWSVGLAGADGSADVDLGLVDIPPFSAVLSQDMGVNVGPGYRVSITGIYEVFLESDGFGMASELDFNIANTLNPPGDGLNFPFASITIT